MQAGQRSRLSRNQITQSALGWRDQKRRLLNGDLSGVHVDKGAPLALDSSLTERGKREGAPRPLLYGTEES
jgi:hypothetical protein